MVAGSMLGVGIFLTPQLVARSVASPAAFLLLWALGGLVAVAGAVAYAELGAMMPAAGGDYVYLRRAFGASTGFAAGWVLFAGVFAGSIASMSAALSHHQLALLTARLSLDLAAPVLAAAPIGWSLTGADLVAIAVVLAFTSLNAFGIRPSGAVQALLTLVPLGVLTAFAVAALVTAPHEPAATAAGDLSAASGGAIAPALLGIYFSYAGWNAIAYVGGEVRDPGRTIPRALIGGTLAVTAVYLLLCGAWIAVLGMDGLARSVEAGTSAAKALLGPSAEALVAVLIALALGGSINAAVLGGARIAYAMGRDGALPAWISRLGTRSAVPSRALWLQGAVAVLLISSGAFDELIRLTTIAMLALGSCTVAALFALRRREPGTPRPYRASLYPVLPLAYLASALAAIALEIREALSGASWFPLLGLAVFAALLLGHRAWRRPSQAR